MAKFTVSQLVSMVRSRLNMEDDDQFVTDTEIQGYLNDSYEELVHLVASINESFFSVKVSGGLTYTGSSAPLIDADGALDLEAVTEADGNYDYVVWKHLKFEVIDGDRYPLKRIEWQERDRYGWTRSDTGRPRWYYIFDHRLYVLPRPDKVYVYNWWFVPVIDRMVTTGELPPEYNFFQGWQNYVVNGACAVIAAKEERDPSFYFTAKEMWRQNIVNEVKPRDEGEPARAMDPPTPDWGINDYLDIV